MLKGFPQGSQFKASYFENNRTNGKNGFKICASRNNIVTIKFGFVLLFKLPPLNYHVQHKLHLCQHPYVYVLTIKDLYVGEQSQPNRLQEMTSQFAEQNLTSTHFSSFCILPVHKLTYHLIHVAAIWHEYSETQRSSGADLQLL